MKKKKKKLIKVENNNKWPRKIEECRKHKWHCFSVSPWEKGKRIKLHTYCKMCGILQTFIRTFSEAETFEGYKDAIERNKRRIV